MSRSVTLNSPAKPAPTEHRPYKADFGVLEQLRGLAALYVVINHCRGNLFAGGSKLAELKPVAQWSFMEKAYMGLLELTSLGHEFVILFFLISGYSITYSLKNTNKIGMFFYKRAIRIYPPYLLGILWALFAFVMVKLSAPEWLDCANPRLLAQRLCRSGDFGSLSTIIGNIFYLPKGFYIVQYWSLTQEIIFYLLIPLLLIKESWYFIASGLLYVASIFLYGVHNPETGNHLYEFLIHYNFFFAIGIAMYRYPQLFRLPIAPKKVFNVLILLLLFAGMIVTKKMLGNYNKVTEMIAVIFSLLLINISLRYKLNSSVMKWLGAQSYTMYITHFTSIVVLQLLLHQFAGYDGDYIYSRYLWMVGVLFCVLCSWVLYLICERPTYLYLNRLRKTKIPAPVTPVEHS